MDWDKADGGLVSWSAWLVGIFGHYSPFSWIVAGLLASFLTAVGLGILSWAHRTRIRAKYDAKFLGSSGPINPLDKTFETRRIYLNDFCLPSHPLVEQKTFIDCEIIGPANIMFELGTLATENKFPRLDAVLLNGHNPFTNGYIFRSCIFRGCSFQRVTIFVPPNEYAVYKDNNILNWISTIFVDEPTLPLVQQTGTQQRIENNAQAQNEAHGTV
jgi:hypothetical protein